MTFPQGQLGTWRLPLKLAAVVINYLLLIDQFALRIEIYTTYGYVSYKARQLIVKITKCHLYEGKFVFIY